MLIMTVTISGVTAIISTKVITVDQYMAHPRYHLLPFSYSAFCEHVYRNSRFLDLSESNDIMRLAMTYLSLYSDIYRSTARGIN